MKNSLIIFSSVVVACLYSFTANASKLKSEFDSLSCLQVEGRITNVEEGNGECLVELVNENGVQHAVTLKEGKQKFKFVLNKNSFYSIRVSKKGFVTKLISVNTEMLTESLGIHIFKFDTSLMTEAVAGKLNQDVIDFPVTIIHFDYELDSFNYNLEYTAYIKKELYKPNQVKLQRPKPMYIIDTTDLASSK